MADEPYGGEAVKAAAVETYRTYGRGPLCLTPSFGAVELHNVEALVMASGAIVVDDSGLELRGRGRIDGRRFSALFGAMAVFQIAMLVGFDHLSSVAFWTPAFAAVDAVIATRVRRRFTHGQLCDVMLDREKRRITLIYASNRRRMFEPPLLSLTLDLDARSLDAFVDRLAPIVPPAVRPKLLSA